MTRTVLPSPRMDPEARQRQLFGVLKRLVERRDRDGPGVRHGSEVIPEIRVGGSPPVFPMLRGPR